MPVKRILLFGNPILRKKCGKVSEIKSKATASAIRDLRDSLSRFRSAKGYGRGIAAPQIGASKRIIFIDIDQPFAMINPRIIEKSAGMADVWDDCFSIPGMLVRIKRHKKISVSYQDENGVKNTLKTNGGYAELLQHEIDHPDGILTVDRAKSGKKIMMRSELN